MARRSKMGRSKSRRDFSRKSFQHPKNLTRNAVSYVMRGGIRL